MNGIIDPRSAQAQALQAVRPDTINMTSEPVWDSAIYAAAGVPQISFFQVPLNQVIFGGAAVKTYADTNMDQAGQISMGTSMLAQMIELHIFPGILIGAQAEAQDANGLKKLGYADDILALVKNGWLEITLQGSNIVQRVPLILAPPSSRAAGYASLSDTTTAGAAQRSSVHYGALTGPCFEFIGEGFFIPANTSFRVDAKWADVTNANAAPTLPSGSAALLRMYIRGQRGRNA